MCSRYAFLCRFLAILFAAASPCWPQLAHAADDRPENYPEASHREETYYYCSACHGFQLVAAQGMPRERWDETLAWMARKHNMPKLDDKEREQILDYLAAAFPIKEKASGGWKNPFQ
jgi:mono/diheme cytochrome c family protein